MVEDFGIDLLQMMEDAGRDLAHLALISAAYDLSRRMERRGCGAAGLSGIVPGSHECEKCRRPSGGIWMKRCWD